jgi:hypothetical protein
MSYGTRVDDYFHQVGVYTGSVLKGAKPADLPVVQSATETTHFMDIFWGNPGTPQSAPRPGSPYRGLRGGGSWLAPGPRKCAYAPFLRRCGAGSRTRRLGLCYFSA